MAGESHVPLRGSERVPLAGARALGVVSEHEWVEVTVKVRRQAPLPEVSGRPQATMSRADLGRRHGASKADIDKVSEVFERYGLHVVETNAERRAVRLGGPVSAIEQAFQVKLMRYAHERGDYRGRIGAVRVPKDLGGIIVAVFGLDNRRVVKRRGGLARLASMMSAHAKHRAWFFPAELATVYDFPPGEGAGQAIGLIEFGGGYFPDDLNAFCNAAGVSVPEVIPVSVDNAPTDQHDGAEGEVMLDIEVVAGACPKSTIAVYFSTFTEQGWVDVLDTAVHDQQNHPTVLSISWGDAEDNASWTAQAIEQINEALQEAALLGVTVCVASGDDGSDDQVGDGHAHVDFPSSSPYVLAVGGTTLHKKKNAYVETAWKDGDGLRKDGGGSTGGGVSVVFDRPSWQTVDVESVNPGAKAGRCIPDVAADASAHTGYYMVVDGQGGPNGGTSASAPLWAALIARLNEALPAGKRAGYLTPLLYQPSAGGGPSIGAVACKDISVGSNSTAAVGGYTASSGYDAVTGWGTPIGSKLLQALSTVI